MTGRIVVINPNSTQVVTDGISAALEPLRMEGGPAIDCLTLAEGPPGVETQAHVDGVIAPMCRLIEANDNAASAFVVACFSDPGLHSAREATRKPVFGIAESSLLMSLTLGDKVGIIAIRPGSIPRHARFIRGLGIGERFAGEIAVGLGVTELADEVVTFGRMCETGERLRDEKGADVVIMGCTGMAKYRERLEDRLGIPVIDPTQTAVGMALTAARFGYRARSQMNGA